MKDISYVVSNIYAANSELASNGEKALEYFKEKLFPDSLYLLDEPENSMAPAYQQELATIIIENIWNKLSDLAKKILITCSKFKNSISILL